MFKVVAIAFLAISAAYAASLVKVPTGKLGPEYNQKPSAAVGEKVAAWKKNSKVNPEELGTYFEGDMLNPVLISGRSVLANTAYRWPNKTVVYAIPASSGFTSASLSLINQAMTTIASNTCIKFKVRTTEPGFIQFQSNNTGCWATLGYTGKAQTVNLQQTGCTSLVGTSIHEILHALGFYHEHTRTDRDTFVLLNTTNIQSAAMSNFNKDSATTTSNQGLTYDTGSVMHYGAYSFAINTNVKTIHNKTAAPNMGQRTQLSPIDIQRIKLAYGC